MCLAKTRRIILLVTSNRSCDLSAFPVLLVASIGIKKDINQTLRDKTDMHVHVYMCVYCFSQILDLDFPLIDVL